MKQQERGSILHSVKNFFSTDWDKTITKCIKNDGSFDDGHPLESEIIVLRKFPQPTNEVSVRPIGRSTYLLLNDGEKGIMANTECLTKKIGYNDVNDHLIFVIDCGPRNGGEKV